MKNLKTVLLIVMGIIILFLLWKGCNNSPVTKPVVQTVIEQRLKIDTLYLQDKRTSDSLNKLIAKAADASSFWKQAHDELQNDYTALGRIIEYELNDPSADAGYMGSVLKDFNELQVISRQKDTACNNTISSLTTELDLTKALVKTKAATNAQLTSYIDTCLLNQSKLTAYANQVKPRNQVYAGITVIGNSNKYVAGYGAAIGMKLTNGIMVEIGALQMSNVTNYTLGIRKVISFKK